MRADVLTPQIAMSVFPVIRVECRTACAQGSRSGSRPPISDRTGTAPRSDPLKERAISGLAVDHRAEHGYDLGRHGNLHGLARLAQRTHLENWFLV